jgi:exonuclease III
MTSEIEYQWKKLWDGKIIFANGTSTRKGVAILFPKNLTYTIQDEIKDPDGRHIAIKLEYEGDLYGLINGYAPTSDKLEEQLVWLKKIIKIIEDFGDTNIIFGGDINEGLTILDTFLNQNKWKESEYVLGWKEVCTEYQISDIWRILNPRAHKYTWKQGTSKKNLRRSRLDFWFISTGLIYSVDTVSIQPGYGSDHSLITLSLFKQKHVDQGPSFWKFNTSLLRVKVYTDKVTKDIQDLKIKYNDVKDDGLKWDLIKMDLRASAISYSKYSAKNKRDDMKRLLEKQIKLESEIANDPSDQVLEEAEKVKDEIERHNEEKSRGAWLRSKATWAEYGEKNSNFFLNLENRNRQVKNITSLIDATDTVITEQREILEEEYKFYKNL